MKIKVSWKEEGSFFLDDSSLRELLDVEELPSEDEVIEQLKDNFTSLELINLDPSKSLDLSEDDIVVKLNS